MSEGMFPQSDGMIYWQWEREGGDTSFYLEDLLVTVV